MDLRNTSDDRARRAGGDSEMCLLPPHTLLLGFIWVWKLCLCASEKSEALDYNVGL